ncbi:MAG: metallophosphoesterase [Flavobacteriaceae bacterium]|nr:metallophosphoesterase [Flavobacteriaceae bacterium]
MTKIDRREFLKQGGILVATTTVFPLASFAKGSNNKVRFGLCTDSHYADRPFKGTRYYKDAIAKMQEFVQTMNDEAVDFVMHLGDFKDEDPKQNPTDTLRYLQRIEKEYAQFEGARYHCIGNHDVDSISKSSFLAHIQNTGIDNNRSYYAFDKGGYHFVVLDANYDKQGKDHFFAAGSDWQDTNIPKEQLDWLQQDLAQTQLPTIVFCHHPLFAFYRGGNKYHINNFKAVQRILENSKQVVAVLQGHVHQESHQQINQIHYITRLGMVDYKGLENNSFSIVSIEDGMLYLKGYKRATAQQKYSISYGK